MKNEALIKKMGATLSESNQGIVCAYLFGSIARGDDHPESDIDVAVLLKERPVSTFEGLGLELAGRLERDMGRRTDLIILNDAPVDLIHRILRDGILIYETDRSRRISFETRARQDYFDILPYLRQYRQSRVG